MFYRSWIKNYLYLFIIGQLLHGCGGNGCKYPDEVAAGGIWEQTQISTVRPLNREIIKQENQFGGYVVEKGVTETMARKNLWTPMNMMNGDTAIVQAGNKMKVKIGDSVVLSGFNQTINATLGNWLPLDGSIISSPVGKYETHDFSRQQPSAITVNKTFKQNGLMQYSYTYSIESNGIEYAIDPNDSNSGSITSVDSACKQNLGAEAINYIFYFPDHIKFDKFPVADTTDNNGNISHPIRYLTNVTIYADNNKDGETSNNLKCFVEGSAQLQYVCTFSYKITSNTKTIRTGQNTTVTTSEETKQYEYRRFVVPTYDGKYASFDEQINAISETLEYEDTSTNNPECSGCDSISQCASDDTNCLNKLTRCNKCHGNPSITAESQARRYLMCLQGGNEAGAGCGMHKVDGVFNHIISVKDNKSLIKVYFKTFDQILQGKTTKTYSFDQCFLKPKSFQINDVSKTISGTTDKERSNDLTYLEYRSRYLSDTNEIVCNDGRNTKIYYSGNCRAVPKRIKYHLHNIAPYYHECTDLCTTYLKEQDKKVDLCTCSCCGHCCTGSYSRILKRFQDYAFFKTSTDISGARRFMQNGRETDGSQYHHDNSEQGQVVKGYHDVVVNTCNSGKMLIALSLDRFKINKNGIDAYDAFVRGMSDSFVLAKVAETSSCSKRSDSGIKDKSYNQVAVLSYHPTSLTTGRQMGLMTPMSNENVFRLKHEVCFDNEGTNDTFTTVFNEEEGDEGASTSSNAIGEVANPEVVSWIDYGKRSNVNTKLRKSSNYNDPNNSFYYDLNGSSDSAYIFTSDLSGDNTAMVYVPGKAESSDYVKSRCLAQEDFATGKCRGPSFRDCQRKDNDITKGWEDGCINLGTDGAYNTPCSCEHAPWDRTEYDETKAKDTTKYREQVCDEQAYDSGMCKVKGTKNYQVVDYIQATGSQSVDLDYKPTTSTRIQFKYTYENWDGGVFLGYYASDDDDGNDYRFFVSDTVCPSGGICTYFDAGANANRVVTNAYISSKTAVYETEIYNYGIKNLSTGNVVATGTGSVNVSAKSIQLFSGGNYGKIYYVKIYEGNTLKRHFVPCVDNNGVAGLYDKQNKKFYKNNGSGSFSIGAKKQEWLETTSVKDCTQADYEAGKCVYLEEKQPVSHSGHCGVENDPLGAVCTQAMFNAGHCWIFKNPNGRYKPLEQGLLPIGSPEIEEIECFDGELPVDYHTAVSVKTKKPAELDLNKLNVKGITEEQRKAVKDAFMNDACKVSGSYKTYKADAEMRFSKQGAGIIPIQWSAASFKTGQPIPVTITTTHPVKVRVNGCNEDDSDDCFIGLTGGNGLAVYIMPNEEEMAVGADYVDPDIWQCNMGMGGSFNQYMPYNYLDTMVKNQYNPRRIESSSNLWWTCDDQRTMWASGYDFINVKSGQPIQYHMYDESDLLYFLPEYRPSVEEPEETVDTVGCNSNGLPSSMIIGEQTISGSDIIGLVYDGFAGACYKYRDANGQEQLIGIYDANIKSKTYEKFKPAFILVDLTKTLGSDYDEVYINNLPVASGGNKLTRVEEGIKAYYQFSYYVGDKNPDYKIPIEDERIISASCYAEGEEPPMATLNEDNMVLDPTAYKKLTDYTFEENNKYYKYDKANGKIFTRYGPFTGFAEDTTSILSPAFYQTEGACFGHNDGADALHFIYDEQHGGTDDNNGDSKHVATYMFYPDSNTPRYNLGNSWRVEFTTPKLENTHTSNENTGTNATCTTSLENLACSEGDEPDVMIVDLSKTTEATTNTNIKGTVVLYRETNSIRRFSQSYYEITSAEMGWNEKVEYLKNDPSKESITCGGKSNCSTDEIPVIKLTKNGESHTLVNGENATISSRKSKEYFTFDYQLKEYTISQANVNLNNTICFASNAITCPSYLQKYITGSTRWEPTCPSIFQDYFETRGIDCESFTRPFWGGVKFSIFTMGKAPYFLACGGTQTTYGRDGESTFPEYRFPYLPNEPNSHKDERDMLNSLNDVVLVGNDENKGLVLQSNIRNFINQPTFARCVSSWLTPKWMLMQQPGDPSTFNTGFNAVSGNYFAPVGQTWSKKSVMDDYRILPVWRTYGGMVNNTVVNQTCTEKEVNGIKISQVCSPSNTESFTAAFKTLYDKQLIFVKSLVNDPINTSDDKCTIYTETSKKNYTSITMNEPFGTVYPSSTIRSINVDKSGAGSVVAGVQPAKTVNGDGTRGEEFFKKTEMYRNWIGAGVIHAGWHVIRQNGSGVAKLFGAGEQISFNSTGSYYVSGNLSHSAQGYCVESGSLAEGGRETLWSLALAANLSAGIIIPIGISECASVVALASGLIKIGVGLGLIFGVAPGLVYAALAVSDRAPGGAKIPGKMTSDKPGFAKRDCPTGVGFRVVPIPPFVCKSGYNVACSNERINTKAFASSNNVKTRKTNIEKWCKSTEQVDFSSDIIPVGRCYKMKYNILSGDQEGGKTTLQYANADKKLLNSLVELPSETLLFTERENVYNAQCGVCVKSTQVYTYNGVTFVVDGFGDIPDDVRTDEHCRQYEDSEGEPYKFVTNLASITPFDNYATSVQNQIKQNVSNRFKELLIDCDKENNYVPSYATQENTKKIKNAFLKASIRDTANCVSIMLGLYQKFASEANTTPACQEEIANAMELKANAVCQEMLARVEAQDGKLYERYIFEQNGFSGVCLDKKDGVNGEPETAPLSNLKSLTRIDQQEIVKKYGYGEMTDGHIYSDTEPASFTINLPKKIRGKEYKTARVGFAFVGTDDADVTKLYKDYRIGNLDDLKRGYTITIGNSQLVMKGKYLYYYIQPLNDNGIPDPNYDPNVILGADKMSYSEIVSDPRVYSYKTSDVADMGNAMITIPRTGKLWWAILDHTGVTTQDAIASTTSVLDTSDGTTTGTTATSMQRNGQYYADVNHAYENKYIKSLKSQYQREASGENRSESKEPLLAVVNEDEGHDGDSDGMVIEFNDDNSNGLLETTDDNYMAVNSGMYTVNAKIQVESQDYITTIGGDDTEDDSAYWTHTIFTKLIIKPLKTIFMGSYQCRYCEKNNLSNCVDYSVKEPEGLKAWFGGRPDYGYKTYSVDDYRRYCDYRWENGLIGQMATSFLKSPVLYYFWFVFVVLSVFVIGWGFVTGSQKFDFKFMKKHLWRYALIMAFVNPQSWELYLRLFVKPTFNLAEGLSAIVSSSFSSKTYNDLSPIGFTSAAFGPVDEIFQFWFSVSTLEKMLAILFSSWAGWLAVVLLLVCLVFFVISVLEAVVLYVVILLKMSLYLAIGPIVFLLLIHEKTASKFTDWWKIIAGLIAEQVTMFTAIAVFCTIYYHILKGSMNFVYCWEPVLKIPILNITLLSMWRISGTLPAHMAELMGSSGDDTAINSQGFNVVTGFVLFIITCLMSKFVDKASAFGAGLFGQQSSMPQEIQQLASKAKSTVQDFSKKAMIAPYKAIGNKIVDKLTGAGGDDGKENKGGAAGGAGKENRGGAGGGGGGGGG